MKPCHERIKRRNQQRAATFSAAVTALLREPDQEEAEQIRQQAQDERRYADSRVRCGGGHRIMRKNL